MKPNWMPSTGRLVALAVARLVRFFNSLLRWIAKKDAPLGLVEFMLSVAVLVMSIAVATMVCTICVRVVFPSPSSQKGRPIQSELQEKQIEKVGQP